MENELYHHGIKGQRWGIRRYQNKDGSLTALGKKRAAKLESDYEKITGKKITRTTENRSGSSKSKSVSDMSNKEIQDRIDRIRLENTLNSLTPQHVSAGEKFVNGLKGAAISIAKDKGTRIVGDYVDKQLRDKLGLNDREAKSASKILQEKAQDYENRQKIDRGEKYFKEGKYAESKEKTKNETYSGTVEGEGTNKKHTYNESRKNNDPIDAEWREVNDSDINAGKSFVNNLLDDKKRGK